MKFDSLRDIIAAWREQHPGKSWEWFGSQCGMSALNVKRLWENQIGSPTYLSARAIAVNALPKEEAQAFLLQQYPDKKRAISRDFELFAKAAEPSQGFTLADITSDYHQWHVFTAANSNDGITKDELVNKGELYSAAATKLLDWGVLSEEKGRLSRTKSVDYRDGKSRMQAISNFVKSMMDRSKVSNVDENGFATYMSANVNRETKVKIREILENAYAQCLDLVQDESAQGNEAMILSTLLSDYR